MRISRLRSLASLTLLVALLGQLSGVCAGWQPTAGARAACCKASGHDCGTAKADDCCAQGEQSEHARVQAASIPATLPDVSHIARFLIPPAVRATLAISNVAPDLHPGIPTHLLLSVLLV